MSKPPKLTRREAWLDLLVYGHNIANLISKHGGWLDDNDQDVVRFPSPYAKARFEEELDTQKRKDNPVIPKVTKHTRAPQDGKLIYCPKCASENRVYNFSWCGVTCQSCWQLVDKPDWLLEKPQAPKDMPPTFVSSPLDEWWTLYNGDGSYTGIMVEFKGKPGDWGPCDVIDKGSVTTVDSIAEAKSVAMGLLRDRKHG